MNLTNLLLLVLIFIIFFFSGDLKWISWIVGVLIILIVIANLFSGTKKIAGGASKELFREMETDMQNAQPKPPEGKYLKGMIRDTGKTTAEFFGPEFSDKDEDKSFWEQLSKGINNFFSGLGKIFRK